MLYDLRARQAHDPLAVDIAIIGGGTAGLYLAKRICESSDLQVAVLESGGAKDDAGTNVLNAVVQRGEPYGGAISGRARGLGGTSQIWGGAMLPFAPNDLLGHPARGEMRWPVSHADLQQGLAQVERTFGLPEGDFEPDAGEAHELAISGFSIRVPRWPGFGRRNMATVAGPALAATKAARVVVNATVTGFDLDDHGIRAAHARALDGSTIEVRAKTFVIAAGAIESTRLLLQLDRDHDGRVFGSQSALGRYLHDHLSAPIGELATANRRALNQAFAFRFKSGGMESLRYERTRTDDDLPAAFVHITFQDSGTGGFAAVRELLQSAQRRRLPPARLALDLAKASPWLVRAAYWRYFRSRVLAPDDAPFHAHLVIEQAPRAANRVALDSGRRDRLEQSMAAIDWHVDDQDAVAFQALASQFAAAWQQSQALRFGPLLTDDLSQIRSTLAEGGGIYHPGGTTRMAETASDGIVDGTLRCFRLPNVHILSTSTFPTGGGANPTLTLLLFAERLAGELCDTRAR